MKNRGSTPILTNLVGVNPQNIHTKFEANPCRGLREEVKKTNKSANVLALCHPPSASFCSVLAGQWSSRIFTHDRYNIVSDILIESEVNLGIVIEKYAKT